MTDNFPTKSLLGLSLYVEEVASQNKVQPSMVAQAALAAFATSVQRNFRVETWYNKSKSIDLNVAMIAVAKSGERKSSIYKEFMKPLLDYMREAEPAYKIELKTANAIEATNKTARNCLAMQYHKASAKDKDGFFADLREVGNAPNPISPRLIINDATVEAIADHLANSRPSIIYMSDEGGKLFANYSMKQENKTNSMAYFNGLLDGEYTSVYRKSSDDLIVQDHSMSMLVFIQPEILRQIVNTSGANFGQGFFQRFLWNYPPSMIGSRQVDPDDILNVADVALSQGYVFNMVIENAFQKEWEWTPNPKIIALEDNARRQVAIFHNELDSHSEIGA